MLSSFTPLLASAVIAVGTSMPAPDSSEGIGWLFVAAGGLFLTLNQGADFIARFRKKDATTTELSGQPIEVRGTPEYVRREEFTALVDRLDDVEKKFDAAVDKIAAAGEDRVRRIHARVDTVLAAVSRLEGELKRVK